MRIESFFENLNFDDTKIVTKVIIETSFSKEIRILLKQGQLMKEHKAPFPILVHVLDGEIDFGVQKVAKALKKGAIISLPSNTPHDIAARKDSVLRLTLSKLDKSERVEQAIANS